MNKTDLSKTLEELQRIQMRCFLEGRRSALSVNDFIATNGTHNLYVAAENLDKERTETDVDGKEYRTTLAIFHFYTFNTEDENIQTMKALEEYLLPQPLTVN